MADDASDERIRFSFEPPPAMTALGRSTQRLLEQMLHIDETREGAHEALEAAREALDRAAAGLAEHAASGPGLQVTPESGDPADRRYYVQGPLLGEHHPLAAPMALRHEDGVTAGSVRFGAAFEGPPGCVHGGFVALFFDQILGHHNLAARIPAMTGTLSVRYESSVPLFTELGFEVRHTGSEGRKLTLAGTLREGQHVHARAEGLFIQPRQPHEHYRELPREPEPS